MDIRIFIVLLSMVVNAGNVFLCCFVGSATKEIFWRYGDISYGSVWYQFPIRLQKYVLLIIVDAQRPRVFSGLGIIELNLIAFGKVLFFRENKACILHKLFILYSRR